MKKFVSQDDMKKLETLDAARVAEILAVAVKASSRSRHHYRHHNC